MLRENKPVTTKGTSRQGTVNRDLEVPVHFFALAAVVGVGDSGTSAVPASRFAFERAAGAFATWWATRKPVCWRLSRPAYVRIVVTALLSGMRQAEVVNLTKDAVDLGAGMLT